MTPSSPLRAAAKPRILLITWVFAPMLALFPIENLWADRWVMAKSAHIPALVPAPLTSFWFIAFALGGLACAALVICQILISLNRLIFLRTKLSTGIAVLCTCLLWLQWFKVTNGDFTAWLRLPRHAHWVALTWKASTSRVVGYNVYKSTVKGSAYKKINSALVRDLIFNDLNVQNHTSYYYVTRAVDAWGQESVNSNEAIAKIP